MLRWVVGSFKRWMCCCVMLVLCSVARSQTGASLLPVEALLHTQQSVSVNWRDKLVPVTDTPFNTFPQQLLKTANGVYISLDGSGRLYQLTDSSASIRARRIDSTIFFGYSFGAFPFVYHDSMYSLGGYGMWRINGQLRVYVPQAHSWDIVPLNEEVPVLMQEEHHDMLWYNEQNEKLYIGYSIVRNQAVQHTTLNEAAFDYTVRWLDLKTKEWHAAGALNNYFKDKTALLRHIAFTPWGQLITFGNKLLLIDYAHNRLLHLNDGVENKVRPVLFQYPTTNLYYCIDSTLYFGNIAENRLSSMPLHANDFADAGIAVYTTPESPVMVVFKWIAGIAIVTLLYVLWRKRKSTALAIQTTNKATTATLHQTRVQAEETITVEKGTASVLSDAIPMVHFDDKEWRLIHLILDNNRNGKPTTIEEVNAVLGSAKSSSDNQKNLRYKVLKSINTKFGIWQNTDDKLIESIPSETDKRTFIYCITPDKEALVAKLLSAAT